MWNRNLKAVNARELAEMLNTIQSTESNLTGDEISFATCFDVDEDGEILDSSTEDWWGTRFGGAFDGTYLIIGSWGGGSWYAYDVTGDVTVDAFEDILTNLFRTIGATTVCVEEVISV